MSEKISLDSSELCNISRQINPYRILVLDFIYFDCKWLVALWTYFRNQHCG